jgi:hypothetical protein
MRRPSRSGDHPSDRNALTKRAKLLLLSLLEEAAYGFSFKHIAYRLSTRRQIAEERP